MDSPAEISGPRPGRILVTVLVLLAYLPITAFVTLHHEPWRDEADPWLVARDANFREFCRIPGHVGSPALWHVLLLPLSRGGLPYYSMHVLHLALAAAAIAVFVYAAPFPALIRILAPFTPYLLYHYAVIARSYVLIELLLWLIAAWWPTRFDRPFRFSAALFLLFNSSAYGFFFAGAICLVLAWEWLKEHRGNSRMPPAAAIAAAGGIVAFLQLLPPR